MVAHFEDSKSHRNAMKKEGYTEPFITDIAAALKNQDPVITSDLQGNLFSGSSEDSGEGKISNTEEQVKLKLDLTKFIVTQTLPFSLGEDILEFIKMVVKISNYLLFHYL